MKTLPPTRVVLRSISPAAVLLGLTLNVLDAGKLSLGPPVVTVKFGLRY